MSTKYMEWVGVAAQDLPKNSVILEIVIHDLSPAVQGELAVRQDVYHSQTIDAAGVTHNSSVKTSSTIKASFAGQHHLKYPPQVAKGTQVKVYTYGNGIFYWESIGRDSEIQKPEIVRFEVSNQPDGKGEKNDTNTYSVTIDTINGKIYAKTSKSNGEKFAYQFTIDARNGTLSFSDDVGNGVILSSDNNTISLFNKERSSVSIGKNITIECQGEISMRAKTVRINGRKID